MAKANRSIPQIHTIRITRAAYCLAQLRARQAVKDQLRKQGLKVSHYAARDITAMACEYLGEYRGELMPPGNRNDHTMDASGRVRQARSACTGASATQKA